MRALAASPAIDASLFDGAESRSASRPLAPCQGWRTGVADALAVALPCSVFAVIVGAGLALFL